MTAGMRDDVFKLLERVTAERNAALQRVADLEEEAARNRRAARDEAFEKARQAVKRHLIPTGSLASCILRDLDAEARR